LNSSDERYLNIVLDPIKVCAQYRPKFGQGQSAGLALAEFQRLYRADSFYFWFGLDNPLMYAAHKTAGGMTSVYRQIGIGCEKLFRAILQDALGLSSADVRWSYKVPVGSGERSRTLSLDARIPLASVEDKRSRERIHSWMMDAAKSLDVTRSIAQSLLGIVFEVRQGYKSKDSKRQNADIANASTAYTKAYLPCAVILSSQIDTDIMIRYRGQKWSILIGTRGTNDPHVSTYDFARNIIGYDLGAFFERNSEVLKYEVDLVLKRLLTAG
jgi:hypothetical protein